MKNQMKYAHMYNIHMWQWWSITPKVLTIKYSQVVVDVFMCTLLKFCILGERVHIKMNLREKHGKCKKRHLTCRVNYSISPCFHQMYRINDICSNKTRFFSAKREILLKVKHLRTNDVDEVFKKLKKHWK